MMNQEKTVCVVVESHRQDTGKFTTSIYGVWEKKSVAQAALKSMAETINGHTNSAVERRMCNPIGQPNDWSVDILEGDFWVCHRFYELTEEPLL